MLLLESLRLHHFILERNMIRYWKMLFTRACLYEWVGEALVQCDPLGGVEHTYLIQEVAQLKNLPGVKLGGQSICVKCMVCEKIL